MLGQIGNVTVIDGAKVETPDLELETIIM